MRTDTEIQEFLDQFETEDEDEDSYSKLAPAVAVVLYYAEQSAVSQSPAYKEYVLNSEDTYTPLSPQVKASEIAIAADQIGKTLGHAMPYVRDFWNIAEDDFDNSSSVASGKRKNLRKVIQEDTTDPYRVRTELEGRYDFDVHDYLVDPAEKEENKDYHKRRTAWHKKIPSLEEMAETIGEEPAAAVAELD